MHNNLYFSAGKGMSKNLIKKNQIVNDIYDCITDCYLFAGLSFIKRKEKK